MNVARIALTGPDLTDLAWRSAQARRRRLFDGLESVGECGVAAAGSGGADGLGERAAGSDEDDELLGAGDAGVEQVALQHHPGGGGERDDHGGVFAALGAVDGDRVGVGEFVEFGEVVVDVLVFVGEHGEGLLLEGQAGDGSDGAVEDARLAFVVVVAQLDDLVAGAEHPVAVAFLRRAVALRGERVLQQGVEVAGSRGSAVHRREHLDIADRVQAEFGGDAAGDDVDDEFGGLLGRV